MQNAKKYINIRNKGTQRKHEIRKTRNSRNNNTYVFKQIISEPNFTATYNEVCLQNALQDFRRLFPTYLYHRISVLYSGLMII